MDTTSLTNNGLNRPNCQYVGILPHKATHILTWFLHSGTRIKFSCNAHKNMFGGPGYLISAMEGWEDNKKRPVHPIGTPEPSQAESSQAGSCGRDHIRHIGER